MRKPARSEHLAAVALSVLSPAPHLHSTEPAPAADPRRATRLMSRRRRPALTFVLALAALAPATAPTRGEGLSSTEEKIVARVDSHRDEAVALLEKMVNIPSETQNFDGVRAVGRALAAEFARSGFTTRWDELPREGRRAGPLIAEHPGTRGKRVLLVGHIDTVLEGRRFERRAGGVAAGPGTHDMKGGDVVLLFALRALHEAGALDDRRVAVILTGDE